MTHYTDTWSLELPLPNTALRLVMLPCEERSSLYTFLYLFIRFLLKRQISNVQIKQTAFQETYKRQELHVAL